MSNSNVLSYNIILSLLQDSTTIYSFNFLIRKYKKFILESPKLLDMIESRINIVIEKHSTPKEAQQLYEVLEELKEEAQNRKEYLKMANIKPFDIMNQSILCDEREKLKEERKKELENRRIQKEEMYQNSQKINKIEIKLREELRDKELRELNSKIRTNIKQRPKTTFADFSLKLDLIIEKIEKIEKDVEYMKKVWVTPSSTHHR